MRHVASLDSDYLGWPICSSECLNLSRSEGKEQAELAAAGVEPHIEPIGYVGIGMIAPPRENWESRGCSDKDYDKNNVGTQSILAKAN